MHKAGVIILIVWKAFHQKKSRNITSYLGVTVTVTLYHSYRMSWKSHINNVTGVTNLTEL